jgi:hypothetical protein
LNSEKVAVMTSLAELGLDARITIEIIIIIIISENNYLLYQECSIFM